VTVAVFPASDGLRGAGVVAALPTHYGSPGTSTEMPDVYWSNVRTASTGFLGMKRSPQSLRCIAIAGPLASLNVPWRDSLNRPLAYDG
jgi:hypothetical protein